MLVDVELSSAGGPVQAILRIVSAQNEDGPTSPKNIGTGLYLLGHWNLECEVAVKRELLEHYPNLESKECIGVCDTPEQAMEYLKPEIEDPKRKFFIGFVRLRKEDQPKDGGWRWHKWGEYIGKQEPQCEYLYDEPVINDVYTFHVYEILAECKVRGVDAN